MHTRSLGRSKDGEAIGGSGIIGGPTTIQSGGTLSPGNSPGQITFLSGLTLNSGSLLAIEFAGTAPGSYDQLDVQGLFTAGGTLQLTIDTGFTPTLGDSFTIFNGTTPGLDAGSFDFVTTNYPGLTWDTSALASTGIITVASVVPEPSTWVLLLLGLSGLALGARRRAQEKGKGTI